MPRSPFDRLDSAGDAGSSKVTLGSSMISAPSKTQQSTAGIGKLSIDLSGPKSDTAPQSSGGIPIISNIVDAVLPPSARTAFGVPIELASRIPGGGVEALRFARDKVFGEPFARKKIERYIERRDYPGMPEKKDLFEGFVDWYSKAANPFSLEGLQQRQDFRKSLEGRDPLTYTLATTAYDVADVAAKGSAMVAAALGGGPTKMALLGEGGKVVGGLLGATGVATTSSISPEELPTAVKKLLDNGATPEEAIEFMRKSGQWYGDDEITNLIAQIYVDPINKLGVPFMYAQRVSGIQDVAQLTGKSFSEIAASQGMNKAEIAIAKRFGFFGSAYKAGGNVFEKAKEIVRGDTVIAIKDVLRMETFVQAEGIANKIGGTAPELLRTGVNRSMQYVLTDAMKGSLSSTAVDNARGYADLVITTAGRDGIEGLRNLEGLRGANDAYLQKFVDLAETYKNTKTDESKKAIEEMTQLIFEDKNIEFLNKELSGPILRNATNRLPVIGKLMRSQTIGAGRLNILRSMQRFEGPIARYMSDPTAASSIAFRNKNIKEIQTMLDTNGNGNAEVVVSEVNDIFNKALATWSAGNKGTAVADLARILEVFRLGRFAKAIEYADAARKLTGLKITPVLQSRFSLDGLKAAIDNLQGAIDSGDTQRIIDTTTDIVIGNDDLAFKFDNVDFEAQLADDPLREASDVLRSLRRLERSGAWVSRLPDDIAAKLDFMENGAEDIALGLDETPLVGGALQTAEAIYNNSQIGKSPNNKINNATNIRKYLINETTEPIAEILHYGEDKLHNYANASNGVWGKPLEVLKHIRETLVKQGADSKITQFFNNPFRTRDFLEDYHNGVRTLRRKPFFSQYDPSLYQNPDSFGNFVKGLSFENVKKSDELTNIAEGDSIVLADLEPASFVPPGWTMRLINDVTGVGSLGSSPVGVRAYLKDRWMGFRAENAKDADGNIILTQAAKPKEFNMPILEGAGYKGYAAVTQLTWNRIFRHVAHVGSVDSLWAVPAVRISKRDPFQGAITEAFGMSLSADSPGVFGYYSQDLVGMTDPIDMSYVGKRSVVIPGDTVEGYNLVFNDLGIDSRAKLYLDPARLAAAYAMDSTARLAVPDLDRIALVLGEGNELLRATELAQSDLRMIDVAGEMHTVNQNVLDWLKKYLSQPVSSGTQLGDAKVFDVISERIVGKRSTIMAEGWERITEGLVNTGLVTEIQNRLASLDHARTFRVDSIAGAEDAFSMTSTLDDVQEYRVSWADMLHGIDDQDALRNIGPLEFDEFNYGAFNFFAQRPFSLIANSGKLDTTTEAILKQIEGTDPELLKDIRAAVADEDFVMVQKMMKDFVNETGSLSNNTTYASLMTEQARMHDLAETMGSFIDGRLARKVIDQLEVSPNPDHWRRNQTFQRIYDPLGAPLFEKRYTSPLQREVNQTKFAQGGIYTTLTSGEFASIVNPLPDAKLMSIINVMEGNIDGAQSALIAEKVAKATLPKPGSPEAEKLFNDEQMQKLLQARASMRELGYEMGIEPKTGYIQGHDVVKGVDGTAVIRPRYDLYTSIDENVDLSGFGLGDPSTAPLYRQGALQKARSSIIPIANNELYDSAVERFRVYLGNKVSREESLRIMANLVERAIMQESNPAGLTELEVADVILNTFGTGEKAAQKYARVFGAESGNASPRAALLYALQGDARTIGLTSNISKRIQTQVPFMATMANNVFPKLRYRYNPYFNQQEAIEPYAFTLLRGIRGEKEFRQGSMLSEILGAPGTFRYDNHEVGAHVLRAGGSVLNEISKSIPKADALVEDRIAQVAANYGKEVASYLVPVTDRMKEIITNRKVSATDVTAMNEVRREVGQMLASEFPDFNKVMYDITGSIDVATNVDALIDMHIYGTIPAKIQKIADVSSAAYTFGVKSNIADIAKLRDDIALRYITPERLAEMDSIGVQLAERIPETAVAKKKILSTFNAYKNSVSKQSASGVVETAQGPYRGKAAVTTLNNVTAAEEMALREWVSQGFQAISRYLIGKNEFKTQPILEDAVNSRRMEDAARQMGKYTTGSGTPFKKMDEFISTLDNVVTTNRVTIGVPIYRGINLSRLLPSGAKIEVGTEFGYESYSSFSRSWDTARKFADEGDAAIVQIPNPKGLLGFDLNAAGASHIQDEAEILLPRATKFRIVQELQPVGDKKQYVVDVILAPDYVSAYKKLSPTESARSALVSAFNDLIVEDAKIEKDSGLLERLLTTSPSILNEVQRMGVRFGEDLNVIRNVRTTRRKASVNPSNLRATETASRFDVHRGVPEFHEQPVRAISAPEIVFGEAVGTGPQATLNVGGRTNTWVGTDGIKRYVKRVATMDNRDSRFAAINEYIANQIYRKLGVSVPQASLVVDETTNEIYHASEWIGGIKTFEEAFGSVEKIPQDVAKQVMDNYVADLIVGNTDVTGLELGNLGIFDDGRVVRIDVGSTAKFKAGGVYRSTSEGTPDLVRPEYVFKPAVGGSGEKLRDLAIRAYPELEKLGSMSEIPTFLSQYSEMRAMMGDVDAFIVNTIDSIQADVLKSDLFTSDELRAEFVTDLARILKNRLTSLDTIALKLKEEASAIADIQRSEKPLKIKGKKFKASTTNISRRLAEAANRDELRLPGLDEALKRMENKEFLTPDEEAALGRGLANFLFQRSAMQDMVQFFKTAHIKGMEIASREQYYNPYKGALERTLNHPFLGPYPTSYMYGKILPAFVNALFKYAPFTSEYAPFVGYRRFDLIADHVAAALETNPELQEYVNSRPPLIMFLNGLLPGWPTDIGVSLPYWLREGIMRPVAEGNLESIPGELTRGVSTQVERAIGPLQSVKATVNALSDIQNFLTGDPKRSVIDEVSDFLAPRE